MIWFYIDQRQIKWQGRSHIHATWETFDTLKGVKGFRKLENYYRRVVEYDFIARNSGSTSREEIEVMDIDRERRAAALEDYVVVDRVISHQEVDGEKQYLIKCEFPE